MLTHTVGANERNGSTCSDEISDESMNKKDVLQVSAVTVWCSVSLLVTVSVSSCVCGGGGGIYVASVSN